MRIQPIDDTQNGVVLPKQLPQAVSKSRLRRLFDRPFKRENDADALPPPAFEPSSLCLDKMVRNFIEDAGSSGYNNDRAAKYGKNRCNCFNGNGSDSSEDEDEFDSFFDSVKTSVSDWSDTLKSLIPCATVVERNLLADTSKIVDENGKACKKKVAGSLTALGYDASICVSKWEKSSSIPAGDYEYIDVVVNGGERLIIDVDFRSEFEIARSTSFYGRILQSLPSIFVGKPDRLLQIVSIAAEAARHSLKKKGMHVAPWREAEYMKSKWLGPYTRKPATPSSSSGINGNIPNDVVGKEEHRSCLSPVQNDVEEVGELDLIFGEEEEKTTSLDGAVETDVVTWQLPAVRCRSLERVVVAKGLASLFNEKESFLRRK